MKKIKMTNQTFLNLVEKTVREKPETAADIIKAVRRGQQASTSGDTTKRPNWEALRKILRAEWP